MIDSITFYKEECDISMNCFNYFYFDLSEDQRYILFDSGIKKCEYDWYYESQINYPDDDLDVSCINLHLNAGTTLIELNEFLDSLQVNFRCELSNYKESLCNFKSQEHVNAYNTIYGIPKITISKFDITIPIGQTYRQSYKIRNILMRVCKKGYLLEKITGKLEFNKKKWYPFQFLKQLELYERECINVWTRFVNISNENPYIYYFQGDIIGLNVLLTIGDINCKMHIKGQILNLDKFKQKYDHYIRVKPQFESSETKFNVYSLDKDTKQIY